MQGMADHLRRAARQPAYEVHEILEGNPALDLGVRFVSADYLEAVEAAFDYLDEHDPTRTGAVSGVEILRVRDDGSEIVWRYGHSEMRPPEDLVSVWGFEPTQTWFRRDAAA
jgi:hypothetical protein